MIKISNIHKAFGGQSLFEGLTFNVNRRERLGLVGRNGHGKTTLFKMILGELEPDDGEIMIPKRYRIGHLEQHLRFTRDTALEEASLGLPAGHRDDVWKAEKILSGLGFGADDMHKPPAQFSGGYQVRLNLAKVLVSEPDLLLLDEPTNYLDIVSIRWLSRFLGAWPSELMLITHDRSFMDSVTTHTVGIHRKRAKKIEGGTEKLYTQILQEEEVYEKTRANDEKKRQQIERFIERFRAKNTLATRVQSRIKFLEKHERIERLSRIESLEFSFNYAPFATKLMMRVEDVAFGYDDGPDLFSGLSFEINSHDRICVIGPNGRGKSTLLRVLASKLTPRRGAVRPHSRLELGHFDQTNVETLSPQRNVVEEIMAADAGCLPQTARNVAGAMMFGGDNALKKIKILSGGEKSRVMLGRLIVSPRNLLLLDEPTNHLDMDSCDSLLAAIDVFDGAVVIVTHNEMFLRTLATRFIVFDRGTVRVFNGTYQDFLDTVGWESDESGGERRRAADKPRSAQDRKRLRQERAKLLQKRSRTLTPLQRQADKIEARIVKLEADAAAIESDMAAASGTGEAAALGELSRKHGRIKDDIDRAFAELEIVSEDIEETTARFARELDELG